MEFGFPMALTTFAVTITGFVIAWVASIPLRNVTVVDFWWGPAFLVVAGLYAGATPRLDAADTLIVLAIGLWALRILLYTGGRFLSEAHEDPRYAAFRAEVGPAWWWQSLPKVFLVQAVLLWLMAMPLHANHVAEADTANTGLLVVGGVLFVAGFLIETIADLQLAEFRREEANRGRVLAARLWMYSRHPNYFGEIVLWLGIATIAVGGGAPLWAFLGPALLAAVIVKVSIPLTEAHLMRTRPAYAEYRKRVSMLLPLAPKARG